eukprot:jgi/Hompol1/5253/HPOL_004279-RA
MTGDPDPDLNLNRGLNPDHSDDKDDTSHQSTGPCIALPVQAEAEAEAETDETMLAALDPLPSQQIESQPAASTSASASASASSTPRSKSSVALKLLDIKKRKIEFKEKPLSLAKHPSTIADLALVKAWLEARIPKIAVRNNYGYTNDDGTSPQALIQFVQDLPAETKTQLLATSTPSAAKRKADSISIVAVAKEAKLKEKQIKEEERAADRLKREQERLKKDAEKAAKKAEKEKKDAERAEGKANKEIEAETNKDKAGAVENELDDKDKGKDKKRKEPQPAKNQKTLSSFFFSIPKEKKEPACIVDSNADDEEYRAFFRPFYARSAVTVSPANRFGSVSQPDGSISPTTPEIWTASFQQTWKLLQFSTDVRPAYFGTYIKTSTRISGRRPFGRDDALLDYDVDSEAEWEEDEPGEELKSEDDEEDDDMTVDDDEDENQWLVPHGYLSDDEGIEETAKPKPSVPRDTAIKRQKLTELVPVISGLYFGNVCDSIPPMDPIALLAVEMVSSDTICIDPFDVASVDADDELSANRKLSKTPKSNTKSSFPDDHAADLAKAIEGRETSIHKLVDEFKGQYPAITKIAIEAKIRAIATRERREGDTVGILQSLVRHSTSSHDSRAY